MSMLVDGPRPGGHKQSSSSGDVDIDGQSVTRTLTGDTAAFGELVERHRDVVYRVAARVVGPDEADDVTQEAFLRAFHRLKKFRGDSSFRAWLLQITYNTAVDAVQRQRADPRPGTDFAHGAAADSEREPASRLEESERRDRLQLKLDLLRPEHRAVLVLRDLEGLPYEDIAVATDTPLGSVKGRLHRARGELIDLLRHNTYDWDLPE